MKNLTTNGGCEHELPITCMDTTVSSKKVKRMSKRVDRWDWVQVQDFMNTCQTSVNHCFTEVW